MFALVFKIPKLSNGQIIVRNLKLPSKTTKLPRQMKSAVQNSWSNFRWSFIDFCQKWKVKYLFKDYHTFYFKCTNQNTEIQGKYEKSARELCIYNKHLFYRVFIKYWVFFENFQIFRSLAFHCFPLVSVSVCTHTPASAAAELAEVRKITKF